MPKRKDIANDDKDSDSGSDFDFINVEFEFFDPRPIDYLAIKRLLNQLFGPDAEAFNVHDLVDLILSQPLVGTTVKTDGIESDPYAFLTVLNLNVHKDHPSVKALVSYLLFKSASNASAQGNLEGLIGPDALSSSRHVGLLLGERLINMPMQVVPPMYQMLGNEIKWANDENEPYTFSHYIVISRLYKLTDTDISLMMEDVDPLQPPSKKKKKKKKSAQAAETDTVPGVYSYHPEDEYIQKVSSISLDYKYSNSQNREGGSNDLGLDTSGRLMVIPSQRFPDLVKILTDAYPLPG